MHASTLSTSPLLLVHAPAIITQHYRDYHNAHRKFHTSYAADGAASLLQLFHQLQPHMVVSADGRLDTEYFRHLVDHILKACLPEEDYQPEAERFIVREIILKVLLNDVIPRITQPWIVQRAILDLQLQTQATSPTPTPPSIPALPASPPSTPTNKPSTPATPPPRPSPSLPFSHNYAHAPLTMLAEISTLPALTAPTTLLTTTRLAADFSSSFLDRLLPHLLEAQFSPTFILTTTHTAKRTLFPNGYPGPPVVEPSPDEQAETRARLVGWRPRGALASRLLPLLLGPDPTKALDARRGTGPARQRAV
ncbi:hypothetical protein DXG01_000034 [Tephrocybe rancida]|nr:hypothetical protein DXG01_000034 [Tephrocybe rancida]